MHISFLIFSKHDACFEKKRFSFQILENIEKIVNENILKKSKILFPQFIVFWQLGHSRLLGQQ